MMSAPQTAQGALFGRILILSGPQARANRLCVRFYKSILVIFTSLSLQPRALRETGERDGVDYHFVSQDRFITDIKQGAFLEWAQVHNNYYGTALSPITQALEQGKLVIFDVDVQGHQSIKEHYGNLARSVFITTRSKEVLRKRLESRQTDSAQNIELRLLHAYNEMQQLSHFDYLIVNDDIQSAKRAIIGIATSLEFIPQPSIYQSLWQDVSEDIK